MTKNYLEYRTVVNVKKEDEFKNGNITLFPVISICRSNSFELESNTITIDFHNRDEDIKRFFNECEYNEMCRISSQKYITVLNNQTLLSDYLNVIDLKQENVFCNILAHYNHDCEQTFGLITSHFMDQKCYTFNSQLSKNFNKSFKVTENYYMEFSSNGMESNGYLYIHDSNELPSFPRSKSPSIPIIKSNTSAIIYEKKIFKLLPAPYKTDCVGYSNTIYRSQAECFYKSSIENSNKKQCSPKIHESITYVVNDYNYSEFAKTRIINS
jgi:hypothetical protein